MTARSPEELGNASAPGDRTRPLVLAVEDEEQDWLIYGKLLWYNGYDVLHAETAEEGLRLAREQSPDVVLADVMLPGMSGIELCEAIKQDPGTRHIPVVLLTGRPEEELGGAAREAGCARYLEKPIGPIDLIHAIADLVGRAPPTTD
ncbi:MAG TPA: response regulator [Longimicrobiales bacterium]|nr:response regulator [Longimicrobiales bacterium]